MVPKAKKYPKRGSKILDLYILVVSKGTKLIREGTQKSPWFNMLMAFFASQKAQYYA